MAFRFEALVTRQQIQGVPVETRRNKLARNGALPRARRIANSTRRGSIIGGAAKSIRITEDAAGCDTTDESLRSQEVWD